MSKVRLFTRIESQSQSWWKCFTLERCQSVWQWKLRGEFVWRKCCQDEEMQSWPALQKGFYYTLATIPLFYVVYSIAKGSEDNFVARQYHNLKEGSRKTAEADTLHIAALSQAIEDRAKLSSFPREVGSRELNYPEYDSRIQKQELLLTCRAGCSMQDHRGIWLWVNRLQTWKISRSTTKRSMLRQKTQELQGRRMERYPLYMTEFGRRSATKFGQ